MRITMESAITGEVHSMDLPITQEQWAEWTGILGSGKRMVQEVFPHLTNAQREFLLTGITPDEWDKYIKPPEGNDDDDG